MPAWGEDPICRQESSSFRRYHPDPLQPAASQKPHPTETSKPPLLSRYNASHQEAEDPSPQTWCLSAHNLGLNHLRLPPVLVREDSRPSCHQIPKALVRPHQTSRSIKALFTPDKWRLGALFNLHVVSEDTDGKGSPVDDI